MASIILEIMTSDCMAIMIQIGLEGPQTKKALRDVVSIWGQS
jgi:hypothetical protein